MPTGKQLLKLAETRIGERYVNVCVPKNNPNWHGPWDCAEYMSWLVYQVGGYLYGCVNNNGDPATVEAYTGAWQTDVRRRGKRVSVDVAVGTAGGILLRYPPAPGSMGHIAVSDGEGGTVEAMGRSYGVRRGSASGRNWNTGVFLPDFTYGATDEEIEYAQPAILYALGRANMKTSVIKDIQRALKDNGVNPGPINGEFSPMVATAVAAFQAEKGLVVDGQVGKQTARKLGITLE